MGRCGRQCVGRCVGSCARDAIEQRPVTPGLRGSTRPVPAHRRSGPASTSRRAASLDDLFDDRRRRWTLLVVGLVGAWFVVVSRRPDALFHPQLWAEDGAVWLQGAYNHGWSVLFTTHAGYLNLFPRLVAALAVHLPLRWAPWIFSFVAILVQVLPVLYLLSRRLADHIPSLGVRLALAALYLAVPNSYEVNANLTNAQWHLAIVGLLLCFAAPPRSAWLRATESVAFVLMALTGPFSILLVPVLVAMWWKERTPRLRMLLVLDVPCAAVQLAFIVSSGASRSGGPLGATVGRFSKIFAGQVVAGSSIGSHGYARLAASNWWHNGLVAAAVTAAAVVLVGFAMARGPALLKASCVFTGAVFAVALASPAASPHALQWQALLAPGAGNRYYVLPMLGWLAVLVWLAVRAAHGGLQWVAKTGALVLLAITVVVGIPSDWRYPPYPNEHWPAQVSRLEHAAPGTVVTIPIDPPGWKVRLRKGA